MKSIGSDQYYTNLLYEESFIIFLNQIIVTEKDPTHLQVAKEILFALKGNKIITYKPYYDGFYKKYKFTLKNVKSTDGFKLNVSSLDGQHQRFLGKMSSVIKPLPSPILPILPSIVPTIPNNAGGRSVTTTVINPINNVNVNAKLLRKPKSKIDPDLPNPFVGPIAGLALVNPITMDRIKSTANKLGDFIDWYPRTSKINYTFQNLATSKANYTDFFNTIYDFVYFRLIWIKPYTITVFAGYADKPYQGTDITDDWNNFFIFNPEQKMSEYWNWNTPGTSRIYKTSNQGGKWWNLEADIPTNGIYLKQKDFPNSDELVKPEPCDQTVITEFDENGAKGFNRPLSFVQNSFIDLVERYLEVNPPTELNPDYLNNSSWRILYRYDKVPEWVMPNWKINNDCAKKIDYYEYKLEDKHKLVNTISITDPDIESITIKDLPGLTQFEVVNCPKLVSIDLSGANNLTRISISDCTKLTSIVGIAGKRYLTYCFVTNTRITSLDLGNCEVLNTLILYNNSLNRLNLTSCNLLKIISVDWNFFSSLDIRSCTNLVNLSAKQNFLTQLDISNNDKLKYLDLSFNKLTETAVDNILQKFVEFTNSVSNQYWNTGTIYLHGGFNARPSIGELNSPNIGMGYYIDLIDPDYDVDQNTYDDGASRLTYELHDEFSGYLQSLYDDKVNYAKLKKDVISSPYYDPVYAALMSLNGPIRNWRRTDTNGEIVPLYKKWEVTINRIDVPLIIFRTYEQ